ncbi:MAG: hypothetical protein JNL38_35055 [Myxococcales bacterium]|nr:hypothetical protein [Myxococcales bacterium]
MQVVGAYSTVLVTLGLVVARPRIGARLRVSPAMAALSGVLVLGALGAVRLGDVTDAASTLWRPLVGVAAIMVMAASARALGLLDAIAARVMGAADVPAPRLFARVFFGSAAAAAILNNDAAILLLTPLVVSVVKRRYPSLVPQFAFAVLMAAGVAPTLVSNPMNLVVATYAGLGFNAYAARMAPVSVVGALVTFGVLRALFHRALTGAPPAVVVEAPAPALTAARKVAFAVLFGVVALYPVASYAGAPVWGVAAGGALVLAALASRVTGESSLATLRREVHWDVLVFLLAVFVLAVGLKNVGFVDHLASAYAGGGIARVGALSALGSATINNHPMGLLAMMALPRADHGRLLAALVGGDLGPRLLPIGSLAGLMWMELLRRHGVTVRVGAFVAVGAAVTVPTLVACLAVLHALL